MVGWVSLFVVFHKILGLGACPLSSHAPREMFPPSPFLGNAEKCMEKSVPSVGSMIPRKGGIPREGRCLDTSS